MFINLAKIVLFSISIIIIFGDIKKYLSKFKNFFKKDTTK
jgi:hypothetical protein